MEDQMSNPSLNQSPASTSTDAINTHPRAPPNQEDADLAAVKTEVAVESPSANGGTLVRPETLGEGVYSVYSVNARRAIVLTTALSGFFSPLSASIYFPALPTISTDLHISVAQVNLTVTTYLIVQGLAPMMVAGFSDSAGRRPAYAVCFIIYVAANLGLSLQNSYAALLVLRCLQSAGSSGAIALADGVVSDIITSSERGSYIAFASIGAVLGPTLSPIIGGLITQDLDWHWIFWFLLIFSLAFCIPFFLFFPETLRTIVGDGSVFPPPLNRSLTDYIRNRQRRKAGLPLNRDPLANPKLSIPNPLSTLIVFKDKQTALVLLPAGLAFGSFYAVATGASTEFKISYGFSEIQVALMFIPIGVGSLLSAITTGIILDWNYRRHARKLGLAVVKNKRQDLINFPVEKARLQVVIPMFYLGAACMIIYGWILNLHVNIAGPIILLFALGWSLSAVYQVLTVLLVDIYPGKGATVTAANNLIRCELGAVAAAVIAPLTSAVGTGWSYSIMALISTIATPCLLLTMRYGMKWRQEQAKKRAPKTMEMAQVTQDTGATAGKEKHIGNRTDDQSQ